MSGPTWPPSAQFGSMIVSGDGTCADACSTERLNAICRALNVPGFAETQGREGNLAALSAEQAKIGNAASNAAIILWLSKSGV